MRAVKNLQVTLRRSEEWLERCSGLAEISDCEGQRDRHQQPESAERDQRDQLGTCERGNDPIRSGRIAAKPSIHGVGQDQTFTLQRNRTYRSLRFRGRPPV